VNAINDRGLWSGTPDQLELVAQMGSAAPGVAGDVKLGSFRSVVINDVGQTAFVASMAGTGIDPTNSMGVWVGEPGDLRLVVRSGDQVPGTPTGAAIESFNSPVLNANGQLAFIGNLFIRRQFGRNGPFYGDPNSGVTSSNDTALWATTVNGHLRLIAREGDLFEVGPNDHRVITGLSFAEGTGNGDGLRSGFNDLGQIAFKLLFADGTGGIFVSDSVIISEPASMGLLCLALIIVGSYRRPRQW
jgi:hypothetical protein